MSPPSYARALEAVEENERLRTAKHLLESSLRACQAILATCRADHHEAMADLAEADALLRQFHLEREEQRSDRWEHLREYLERRQMRSAAKVPPDR